MAEKRGLKLAWSKRETHLSPSPHYSTDSCTHLYTTRSRLFSTVTVVEAGNRMLPNREPFQWDVRLMCFLWMKALPLWQYFLARREVNLVVFSGSVGAQWMFVKLKRRFQVWWKLRQLLHGHRTFAFLSTCVSINLRVLHFTPMKISPLCRGNASFKKTWDFLKLTAEVSVKLGLGIKYSSLWCSALP